MNQEKKVPYCIHVETINYCNGTCRFCPNNRMDDKRERRKMEWQIFCKLIDELVEIKYRGILILNGNNEPFLDDRITEFVDYAAQKLPDAQRILHTNGTLLTEEKLACIAGKLNQLYINNYHTGYKLLPHNDRTLRYIKKHAQDFDGMNIIMEYRYCGEILTNRAGEAPNKRGRKKEYRNRCPIPYMECSIYPDGSVGFCSNDCYEVNRFGNLNEEKLMQIYNGPKLGEVRRAMQNGRNGFPFCRYCDFVSKQGRREHWMQTGRD